MRPDVFAQPLLQPEQLLGHYLAATNDPRIGADSILVRFSVFAAVVKHWMGEAWLLSHLNPDGSSFLRLDPTNQNLKRNLQLWDLAELLLNLQHVDGFRLLMKRMQSAKDRDIESYLGELRVARIVYANGYRFRFLEAERSVKSPDLEITLEDGTLLQAETKCKVTSTTLTASAIDSVLKKAVKQLRPDCPGVIFVNFPQEWGEVNDPQVAKETMREVVHNFLAKGNSPSKPKNTRIVSVVMYCEPLVAISAVTVQGHIHLEIINPWNRFDKSRDWRLMRYQPPPGQFTEKMSSKWIRLVDLPADLLKHTNLATLWERAALDNFARFLEEPET